MNGNEQMGDQYLNPGFPYPATENFMGFFQGYPPQAPTHYVYTGAFHDQETAYWSMNTNLYKFGFPGSGSTSYYDPYGVVDHVPGMDFGRRAWEYSAEINNEEPVAANMQSEENVVHSSHATPEEPVHFSEHPSSAGSPNHQEAVSPDQHDAETSQVVWQDDIDPDSMTYEELLDLGEAVGTESRGLSEELIELLPTSKYKSGGIFSRKRSEERCVICQMRYKRGDRQINLPCKHIYHTECGSKWLRISKTCPVCNAEVFGDGSKHE